MDLATPSPAEAEDEWELCNDDGFVYKRKKRRLDPSAAAAPPPPQPPPDPLAEENHRRERKRKALLKIKGRYQEELALWEHLSNTCRAMQEKARELQLEREKERERASSLSGSADEELDRQRSDFGSTIDKLLLQAEAQEALINDVSNLCDVAEELSSVQEEQLKQSLFDLPVWASPQELMAALCDELNCKKQLCATCQIFVM
ncbi:uncharacterized protein LOC115751065 [Rhodamnia argentea]|uniref:Uncharacterized protein LOC115751065 n=1 Tax=Rhodamnia argentea TaxID=178133 RepID=A0A8B8QBU6_9MYRT|nr:uncharacterized protein LOC115751065 [Rhodamnia argentea]